MLGHDRIASEQIHFPSGSNLFDVSHGTPIWFRRNWAKTTWRRGPFTVDAPNMYVNSHPPQRQMELGSNSSNGAAGNSHSVFARSLAVHVLGRMGFFDLVRTVVTLLLAFATPHDDFMSTANHKISFSQSAFWAAILAFVTVLLAWQSASGMKPTSLPGVFLSLGMLSLLSREFWPAKEWLRRFLLAISLILFALSLIVSARLVLGL